MIIDEQTRRKLRLMGADHLLDALERQDERACAGMTTGERVALAVDDAYNVWADRKITAMAKRAKPRYPQADLRTLDLIDERGLDRNRINQLQSCAFITQRLNILLTGATGSGKSWLACAIVKQACRQSYRSLYTRMPDLAEQLDAAASKPAGTHKLIRKYANYTLLVLDEWLLDKPDERMRSFLLEVMELRYDTASTVLCTQYPVKDWHQRLGGDVTADAIMDRIVHNGITIDTGDYNMRQHHARQQTNNQ
ncbi:ATP-binding protein [Bifidobacterium pullorum]|uniref:ATP-binding protein n=1 Tax=Bifidobacterium pullorum subsp. gallinarum TaxID=78344 RepID=A0A921LV17_9BIFI|nr:ATP-binding protein [Bifidobacterium pullorum]HJG41552.1 ATP-binding protein [Bifidobacterium pullorum subsp. gallinarum]